MKKTGMGLENVPQIYKPLIGNVYRAEWSGGHGYKWYILLGAYVNKDIKFLVNSSASGFPFIIVCPEDNEKEGFNCYVQGAKEGSASNFARYKILLKKGLPVIYQNNENAEFYEAGNLPVLVANEAKPLSMDMEKLKKLEGGRWEALNFKIVGGSIDYIIVIDKITNDGKVIGTYSFKRGGQAKPAITEINSKVGATPDGLPRLVLRSPESGLDFWVDMQNDGSLMFPNGSIAKRVIN